MIPALKSCYVRLNRNFVDIAKSAEGINFPKLGMKNCEKSYRSKISDPEISSSKIIKEHNHELRNKERINYSDEMTNRVGDASDSEFSYDSSSSDDDESTEQKRKKKDSITNPKKLRCSLCNKSFGSHLSYLSHKRSHQFKPFHCILCSERSKNRQSFINHMKKYHPEVEPFVCDYPRCELNFKTQKGLENHRKIHRKYMCKYCKKLYCRKDDMKWHISRTH